MFLKLSVLWSAVILLQCLLQGSCKFNFRINLKKPSPWTISIEASINDDRNEKTLTVVGYKWDI